ncbi:MAG: hypothetical protein MJA31_20600 [Clostridia bacterium]|nr:hypothetical protein [Clostridia bacterium]
MEFHYWFLIQDILGVLLAALGFKFAIIYMMIMIKRCFLLKHFLCLIGNIMFILAGINLIFSPWCLKTWGISFLFFIFALLFGRLVYKREY